MNANPDPLASGTFQFDTLESQVNNVVAGKPPSSMDFSKLIRNPWVYGTALFVIFLLILWTWSPGFLKNDDEKTKVWLLLLIAGLLSVISGGLIWFFTRKKD